MVCDPKMIRDPNNLTYDIKMTRDTKIPVYIFCSIINKHMKVHSSPRINMEYIVCYVYIPLYTLPDVRVIRITYKQLYGNLIYIFISEEC